MSWRESQAGALDDQAAVIDAALEAIGVADAVLEARRREQTCHELRAAMALLRSEASAIRSEASGLRSEPSSAPLPMAVTTRFPRRRPAERSSSEEEMPHDRDGPVHEPQAGDVRG